MSSPQSWPGSPQSNIHVIDAQTNYSERYVYRLKAQALRELGKLLRDHAIDDTLK